MKKFFMALLRALGYFGIFFASHLLVTNIWGNVISFQLEARYEEQGLSIYNPRVSGQYMEEYTQELLKISVKAAIIANVIAIATLCIIFVCRKEKLTTAFSLRKFSPRAVLPIIMMGLGSNVLISLVLSMLPEKIVSGYQESSSALTSEVGVWTLLATVVMAPLAEELAFRGLVFTRMKKGMPVIVAMILSSILFGVLHGQWLWMIFTTFLGMGFVWVFERTKSLYAAILFHFTNNLCAMLLTVVPGAAPDWLGTGLVAIAVVFTAVGVFLFIRIPKAEEPVEEVVEVAGPAAEGTENL